MEVFVNASPRFKRDELFWKGQLPGEPVYSIIPYDRNAGGYEGQYGAYSFSLPEALSAAVHRISNGSHIHVLVLLLATCRVLLRRYSAADEIVLNTTTLKNGAIPPDGNNLLVLKAAVQHKTAFRQLLMEEQVLVAHANEHACYPLLQLVEERGLGSPSFYAVPLVLLDSIQHPVAGDENRHHVVYTFSFNDQQLSCTVQYRESLYSLSAIRQVTDDWMAMLGKFIAHPQMAVEQVLDPVTTKEAPASELQKRLTGIWSRLLGINEEDICINMSFFLLGGHSLKAMSMAHMIQQELGIVLPVNRIFEHPTIERLAGLIAGQDNERAGAIPVADKRDLYPLSPAQQRMYILSQLDNGGTNYNIPLVLKLEGALDLRQLEQAFHTLINRHQVLRAGFHIVNGSPVQKIHEQLSWSIDDIELLQGDLEMAVNAFVRPFDIAKPPLLRVGLIKQEEHLHVLMIDIHHIIADGISVEVLANEFSMLYNGGEPERLRIQYPDYIIWHQARMADGTLERQKAWWMETFRQPAPLLHLPLDYPRPDLQCFEGAAIRLNMGSALKEQLELLAASQGVTLHMVLFAAYYVLLYRYTGQEDMVIGCPVAGREHADTERMVGMFVNTLAVRNYPAGNKTFAAFLQEVKTVLLACLENQDYQFEELVRSLDINRDSGRHPVFDTLFDFQHMPSGQAFPGALHISPVEFGNRISKFDLDIKVSAGSEELRLDISYSTRLFSNDTIERLGRHYINILEAVCRQPATRLNEVDMLEDEERKVLLYGFNDTERPFPGGSTIHQLFEEQAAATPEHIAVVYETEKLTYRELNERADALATLLKQKGVKPGDVVGLQLNRSAALIYGMLGILKAGAAYLPVDVSCPPARTGYMLKDTGCKLLLTRPGNIAPGDFTGTTVLLNGEVSLPVGAKPENVNVSGDLAYVMYTSGTSGKPKGVTIKHRSVVRLVKNTNYVRFGSGTRVLQTGAVAFDATTFEIWGPLLNGGSLYLVTETDILEAARLKAAISRYGINTMWLTAPLFDQLCSQDPGLFQGLGYLVVGGDALSPHHINKVRELHPELIIVNGYGPTENTTFSTTFSIDSPCTGSVPIGKPVSNSTAYILNEALKLQPVGVIGELYVGGEGLAAGYLNNEELTREKFLPHPFIAGARIYRTGDLARWRPDGNILFMGRKDQQVKIRGYRIEPAEIENRLLEYPPVKEAFITDISTASGARFLCAYYTAASELPVTALKEHLALALADYMIPACFVYLEKIPLTPNGKVDKEALPLPGNQVMTAAAYEAPQDETEEKLAAIWETLLAVRAPGVNESFFDLGGHSLNAVLLTQAIREKWMVEVPLKTVFSKKTIRELAAIIRTGAGSGPERAGEAEKRAYYSLSPAQKRLYAIWQMNRDILSYNMPGIIQLPADVSHETITNVLRRLVSRHDSLRTSFHLLDANEGVQKVHEKVNVRVEYIETQDSLQELAKAFVAPFDLSVAPLLRATMVKRGMDSYLLLDTHHIINDGYSQQVLEEEFNQLLQGKEPEPPGLQYKDYVQWISGPSFKASLERQQTFWAGLLKGELPLLNIPADYERQAQRRFTGSSIRYVLPDDQLGGLRAFCKQQDLTMFMLLLAAYKLFLAKVTAQEDVIVGVPVAGRADYGFKRTVGMFVNYLPVRSFPVRGKQVAGYLREIKEVTLEAFKNQDYQYDDMIMLVRHPPDQRRNPLFDVVFNFVRINKEVPHNEEEAELTMTGASKLDLLMTAVEFGNRLVFELEYDASLFERDTARYFMQEFERMIRKIITDPNQSF